MRHLRARLFLAFAVMASLMSPGSAAASPAGAEARGKAPERALGRASQRGPGVDLKKECARLVAAKGKAGDARRLRDLLEVHWRYLMADSPESATQVGYPGQNARWSDLSLEAIARRQQDLREPLGVLDSIDRARLGEADRLNYDLFRKGIEEAIEGARFRREYMPITQLGGVQQTAAQIFAMMPAVKASDFEDRVARLEALPRVIDQTIVLLGKGLEAGITPPRITLRDVPDQVKGQIADDPMESPLLRPFKEMPQSIPSADQERLRDAAARAYAGEVRPAFERLRAYLADTYLPRARESIGMSELPDGPAWYAYAIRQQTTTSLAPQRIHEIGLSEVKRIRAEMDEVIKQVKFKGSFSEFCEFLRTDDRFFFDDPKMLVMTYRDICKRADPGLVRLFGRLPRLPYGVVEVPAFMAKSQTTAYYEPGSPQSGRAGEYFVNTYDLHSRPKWEMEALTLHESVPGHHLQIALSQEQEDLPDFRKYGGYNAFVEGWALYAEGLGSELGMYQDPYSKFGQLTYEIWRAIRLVVDTGIHSMGWSRQQAIDYFKENSAKTEHDIEVEIDRYIVDPGQALGYKLGQLKIKELRDYATRELGDRFDLRAFHDEVLREGGLPLDLLDARLRSWVAARKTGGRDSKSNPAATRSRSGGAA